MRATDAGFLTIANARVFHRTEARDVYFGVPEADHPDTVHEVWLNNLRAPKTAKGEPWTGTIYRPDIRELAQSSASHG